MKVGKNEGIKTKIPTKEGSRVYDRFTAMFMMV